ncbi:hypothetical protein [Paracoccus mutanolyticus]|uniref:hypothetical protein n=1 Tax=Paracoccus mutanolyticus TaxID=1499308 RepID=UPI001CB8F9B0|nr:hypothetical protein [Paracoccus mutanolyticus]
MARLHRPHRWGHLRIEGAQAAFIRLDRWNQGAATAGEPGHIVNVERVFGTTGNDTVAPEMFRSAARLHGPLLRGNAQVGDTVQRIQVLFAELGICRWGWGDRVWTWHEAADTRLFHPPAQETAREGLVWIGNWGDGERTEELETFSARRGRRTPSASGTRSEIEGYRAHWAQGTPERIAFEVIYWTGARCVDAVRLGWQMVDQDGWLSFVQSRPPAQFMTYRYGRAPMPGGANDLLALHGLRQAAGRRRR